MSLNDLFDSVSKTLKENFEERAKLLGHPGEVGTGRENVLKSFLEDYLPKRYIVDSGFVVDALANRSQQMDVVIYESNYTPVFEIVKGKRFFPCETVVAVGQVRTAIKSRDEMQDCLENIKSVKQLDRSNRGTNKIITGPGISLPLTSSFDPSTNFRDQIFGFIFCSSSMKTETVISELQKYNRLNERKLWANLIVDYNKFLIEYEDRLLMQDPMNAKNGVLIDKSQTNLLSLFLSILNNFLNMAHIARPDLFAYCKLYEIPHYGFDLTSK